MSPTVWRTCKSSITSHAFCDDNPIARCGRVVLRNTAPESTADQRCRSCLHSIRAAEVSDEAEIWTAAFLAALNGTATNAEAWPEDRTKYILNRAEHIADEATKRVLRRRAALERS